MCGESENRIECTHKNGGWINRERRAKGGETLLSRFKSYKREFTRWAGAVVLVILASEEGGIVTV